MHPKFTKARLELCQEAYAREAERRTRSIEQLTAAMAVYSFVCALAAYYFCNLPYEADGPGLYLFIALAGIGCGSGLLGLTQLGRILFFGQTFLRMQDARTFDNSLQAAANQYPQAQYDRDLVAELEAQLLEQYREITADNRQKNDAREKIYQDSLKCAVLSTLFLLLASPSYFYCRSLVATEPTPVKIINPVKVMPNETPRKDEKAKPAEEPKKKVRILLPKPEPHRETLAANINLRHPLKPRYPQVDQFENL